MSPISWTAPRTWVAGEIVTAALLNAQIRDNELVLATVPSLTVASASSSFSKTADMKWHIVEGNAGGASGSSAGGGASGQAAGAGGGGGGYFKKLYASSALSASESFTVGVGGSGNGGAGNSGTNTVWKSCTANAGTNGTSMANQTGDAMTTPGTGGTASGGDENLTGDDGGRGVVRSGIAVIVNHGGGSPRGGGTAAFTSAVAAIGQAGKFPGGGASGSFAGTVGFSGANGAGGQIIIASYFAG